MRRAWLPALFALAACAGPPPAGRIPDCPGELPRLSSIPDGLRLHLRMRVSRDERDTSLELAVEKRPGELVLVGFDALGVVAFHVVQRPGGVEVERRLPASLQPVPPLNVLRDLNRAGFLDGHRRSPSDTGCGYRVTWVELPAAPAR